jgi:glycosyltransferase involved in cell wall biosynthesis
VPVMWTPLGWPSQVWTEPHGPVTDLARYGLTEVRHAGVANQQIEHDTVVVHSPPIWNETLAAETAGRTAVAFTTWETDRLPPEWVPVLNRYDRVLVPSQFNLDAFVSAGVRAPVYVVPHLVDETFRSAAMPASDQVPSAVASVDGFVFYAIATWITRKALAELVTAYLAAFSVEDDVTLLIHTTPVDLIARGRLGRATAPHPAPLATWFTITRLLAGQRRAPRIVLSTDALSDEEVHSLHLRGDCFVSLSRGEGWGLGAFDAGGAGNPAIITGWGGSLDYIPDGYPYLVEYDLIPTTVDEPDDWWEPRPGERWAKARVDHAAALMRHVFEHPDEARRWGAALQSNIVRQFSAPVVRGQLLSALGISNAARSLQHIDKICRDATRSRSSQP